jgi:hypothetical protein
MSEDEVVPVQTIIMINETKTTATIVISAKDKLDGATIVDILDQLIDDYREQPESLISDSEEITLN